MVGKPMLIFQRTILSFAAESPHFTGDVSFAAESSQFKGDVSDGNVSRPCGTRRYQGTKAKLASSLLLNQYPPVAYNLLQDRSLAHLYYNILQNCANSLQGKRLNYIYLHMDSDACSLVSAQ